MLITLFKLLQPKLFQIKINPLNEYYVSTGQKKVSGNLHPAKQKKRELPITIKLPVT